ncbi:phosphotransferase [Candidatus Sumerlaeota bacterium]|nr:phosphotransferase [Candidatus Sumerlaeota bacterium]
MSLDALKTDFFLKRYIERRARTYARLPEGEIQLVIPLAGVRSIVRLIQVDGVSRAVVRVYSRREGAAVDHRLRSDALVENHRLDAPRLLDIYESRRQGMTAVVEEFVRGVHPDPIALDDRQIEALARTFVRLLEVRSPEYGRVGDTRRGDYSREAFRRFKNRFRSVRRWAPPMIGRPAKRLVRRWFRDWSRRFAGTTEYSLVHDKPNLGNVLWDAEAGRFVLIDLTTLSFGCPAKDLVQVEHEVLGGDATRIERFQSRYFSGWDTGAKARYDELLPYHHAYYRLCECAINCRRESKHSGSLDHFGADFVRKAADHWQSLMEIVESNPA